MPVSSDLLSPHFTVQEFTASATADRLGLWNWPGAAAFANLERLAAEFEKVRTLCGNVPFLHRLDVTEQLRLRKLGETFGVLTNAYRSPELNAAVGGKPTSAHQDGRALDFLPPKGWTLDQLQQAIGADPSILFDRILEERTADGTAAWLHFQIADEGALPKRLVLDLVADAHILRKAEA